MGARIDRFSRASRANRRAAWLILLVLAASAPGGVRLTVVTGVARPTRAGLGFWPARDPRDERHPAIRTAGDRSRPSTSQSPRSSRSGLPTGTS